MISQDKWHVAFPGEAMASDCVAFDSQKGYDGEGPLLAIPVGAAALVGVYRDSSHFKFTGNPLASQETVLEQATLCTMPMLAKLCAGTRVFVVLQLTPPTATSRTTPTLRAHIKRLGSWTYAAGRT